MSPIGGQKQAKGARGKADVIFSKIVRSRGVCQSCGERDYSKLQCAHIIPRRYSAVRVELDNAWALCASCHFRTTEHADEFMDLVDRTIGFNAFYALKDRAQSPAKVDWPAEVERLKLLLRELEAA